MHRLTIISCLPALSGPLLFVTSLLLALVAGAENVPAAAARMALADLQSQPSARRGQLRYLSIANDEQAVAVNYVWNAISRTRSIVRGEIAGQGLLRIDLAAFADPRDPATVRELHAAWERLVETDPYLHLRTQVALAGSAPQKSGDSATASIRTVTVDGGWIDARVAGALRTLSGSAGVVLRADYFVASAASAPRYYEFAGIPVDEAGLLKRLGVDRAVVDRLSADTAANLLISQITHKARRIVHLPGPLGGVWFTRDIAQEAPDRDPLRIPINFAGPAGLQTLRYDAAEWFALKENKFWLTAVFDGQGRRQDAVADAIAKDATAHDGIVRPLISCVRCHELNGGAAGLHAIHDDQYPLIAGEAAILGSYLPEVARRIGELYDPSRLQLALRRDREDHIAAVVQATGRSPHDAVEALSRVYTQYVDRPVTVDVAAAEVGLAAEQFIAATRHSADPIVLALRARKAVKRGSFAASFPEIMLQILPALESAAGRPKEE